MMELLYETTSPFGEAVTLHKRSWSGKEEIPETVSFVSGLHGHSLTGLYSVMRLAAFLDQVLDGKGDGYQLAGNIQVFPVIHLRAMEAGAPVWNFDHLDTNVAFPGTIEGELTEKLCNILLQHTVRSDFAVVLKGPERWWQETPHVSLLKADGKMKKHAASLGLEVALLEEKNPLTNLQLLKQWHDCDLKALAIGTGEASILDKNLGEELFRGLLNYLLAIGSLTHPEKKEIKKDTGLYAADGETTVTCRQAGFFLSEVETKKTVDAGQKLGEVRGLYDGKVLEEIIAPEAGLVFAQRHHPLLCSGEPVVRLLTKKYSRWSRFLG